MPALIDLRRRIKSVRNTQQITQAMKSVATAKFKKAQRMVLETRPYWHHQPELMDVVATWAAQGTHPLLEKRREKSISHAEAQHQVETFWMGALRKGVKDGDIEYGSLMAGQSIGLVNEIRSLKKALEYLIAEAEEELERVKNKLE